MSKEALKLAQHWSDCAVHSEPAYPKGKCDCGGIVAAADYTALSDKYVALSYKYVALSDKYVALKAQPEQEPAKRPWVGLTAEEAAECWTTSATHTWRNFEAKLKEKNT